MGQMREAIAEGRFEAFRTTFAGRQQNGRRQGGDPQGDCQARTAPGQAGEDRQEPQGHHPPIAAPRVRRCRSFSKVGSMPSMLTAVGRC